MAPDEINDLFVVSCTGFDIPGLDLHMAGRLCMRPDLQRTCILGMGCYAAFPALRRATETVLARPGARALVLCLELCSLHMQLDDSTENSFSYPRAFWRDHYLAFTLRRDLRRIPSVLFRTYLKKAESEFLAAHPVDHVGNPGAAQRQPRGTPARG